MTVHASGGRDMMAAAVKACAAGETGGDDAGTSGRPKVLAITVLTSTDAAMLQDIGITRGMDEQVVSLAFLAREAGCDGVVCSPREAQGLRQLLGEDATIVTPGVRPAGSSTDDQKRVATPAEAIEAGASYLVIGRPITAAEDPVKAFEELSNRFEEDVGRPGTGDRRMGPGMQTNVPSTRRLNPSTFQNRVIS